MRLTLEEVIFNNSNRKEFSHLNDFLKQEQKELIEYKTIEEELGIDLIVLFKALKQGTIFIPFMYDFDGNILEIIQVKLVAFSYDSIIYENVNGCNTTTKLKYYGKTWALAKEELL